MTTSPLLNAADLASRVIVLANSADPDSIRIGRHYADVRSVPVENVIALPMPLTETISWHEFVQSIWEPLQRELVQRGWIDAIKMNLVDEVGRTKLAVSGHRISYLVVCRGVPLRIVHDPQLFAPAPPMTDNPLFRTNAGAVDGELSLLVRPNHAINAFLGNALYANDQPTALEQAEVIKVTRLDGPSADDAYQLVDLAVAAERTGLVGRAYVDLGGSHPDGDRWLESAARQLVELSFDTDVDRAPTTIGAGARFDAPVLYFGWYASAVNGPFALPGFRFPPGAIALHIHSYSAETLRSVDSHWCGPLVARGVTATVGNVFEPYLQLTHRPDLLLRALARGATWGDAVAYAQPALSWQTIAIGDPLYRPFAMSLDEQWVNRSALMGQSSGYVAVRRMIELESLRRPDEALAFGRERQRQQPSLELGVALAQRFHAAADSAGVGEALAGVATMQLRADQWALARTAAELLGAAGHFSAAVQWCQALFGQEQLPVALRTAWLPQAIRHASAAHDDQQAEAWRKELQELTARSGGAVNAGSARREPH